MAGIDDFNDRRVGTKHSPSYGEYAKRGDDVKAYTSEYRRGYRHSITAVNPNLDKSTSDSWMDGYVDAAAGRPRYALRGHRFGTGDPVDGY